MSVSYYKVPRVAHFSKGFTLLELIIAVSLTTILMTVLVVGINNITRDWGKNSQHLEQKLDESLLLLQIEKAILGTVPYKFKANSLAKEKLFFKGTQTELGWISTVSPDRSTGLMLWHIKAHEGGGISFNVLPAYPGNINTQLEQYYAQQPEASNYFKDYKVTFFYLSDNTKKIKQWSQSWNAKDKDDLPLAVRIEFKNSAEHVQDRDISHPDNYEIFAFIRARKRSTSSVFGGGSKEKTGLLRPRDN